MNGKRWFPHVMLALGVVLALAVGAAYAQNDGQPFLGFGFEPGDEGVVVTRLLPGGPADEAGLEAGDVITAVDGETVTADTIAGMIGALNVGDEVELSVVRDDEALDLTATLGSRDDLTPQADHPSIPVPTMPNVQIPDVRGMMQQRVFLGVSLEDTDDGVVVREVLPDSPATAAGVQADDVITAVNGEAVTEARQIVELIAGLEAGDTVTLDVTRDGEAQTLEATLAEGSPFPSVPMGRFSQDVVIYDAGQNVWQVIRLSEDNPLYVAGLRDGDQITGVNGEAVAPDALMELLNELEPDATATLTVQRDGEELTFDIPAEALQTFAQMPTMRFGFGGRGDGSGNMMPFDFGGMNRAQLGVGIVDLTAETAAEEGVEATQGALVKEVAPDSPAAEAGVQVDDIITAVNGEGVDEERTLRDRLFAYEPGDTVTLTLTRGGETLDVDVTLAEADMPMFEGFPMDEMPFSFNVPVLPPGHPDVTPEDEAGPIT